MKSWLLYRRCRTFSASCPNLELFEAPPLTQAEVGPPVRSDPGPGQSSRYPSTYYYQAIADSYHTPERTKKNGKGKEPHCYARNLWKDATLCQGGRVPRGSILGGQQSVSHIKVRSSISKSSARIFGKFRRSKSRCRPGWAGE